MRMIDKDALIKSMKSHTVEDNGLTNDYKAGLTDSIRTAVALAENASTIEAAPVVRGEWMGVTHGRGGHECSKCRGYAPSFQNGVEYLSNYCPNCGAKMESEEV